MNILGLDELVFGVDDVAAVGGFLRDYGLADTGAGRFEAVDGTAVVIAPADAPGLPAPLETGSLLRKTVYAVGDERTLDDIARELSRDREVNRLPSGALETRDDMGFVLGFQLTRRRAVDPLVEVVNAPGSTFNRRANDIAVRDDNDCRPRTLSHVVYFVPDEAKASAFYEKRLGFRCTDRLNGAGGFLRPAGTSDHHSLFQIQTPPHMKGVEHFTFHLSGPTAVLQAGERLVRKGYESFWGPGRHRFGSNWFWYFKSPLRCHIEYDADMDLHDDSWVARQAPMSADSSQLFLFQHREKWAPGGPPPGAGGVGPPGAGGVG